MIGLKNQMLNLKKIINIFVLILVAIVSIGLSSYNKNIHAKQIPTVKANDLPESPTKNSIYKIKNLNYFYSNSDHKLHITGKSLNSKITTVRLENNNIHYNPSVKTRVVNGKFNLKSKINHNHTNLFIIGGNKKIPNLFLHNLNKNNFVNKRPRLIRFNNFHKYYLISVKCNRGILNFYENNKLIGKVKVKRMVTRKKIKKIKNLKYIKIILSGNNKFNSPTLIKSVKKNHNRKINLNKEYKKIRKLGIKAPKVDFKRGFLLGKKFDPYAQVDNYKLNTMKKKIKKIGRLYNYYLKGFLTKRRYKYDLNFIKNNENNNISWY